MVSIFKMTYKSERNLIEKSFQKLGFDWHIFKCEYQTDTSEESDVERGSQFTCEWSMVLMMFAILE